MFGRIIKIIYKITYEQTGGSNDYKISNNL